MAPFFFFEYFFNALIVDVLFRTLKVVTHSRFIDILAPPHTLRVWMGLGTIIKLLHFRSSTMNSKYRNNLSIYIEIKLSKFCSGWKHHTVEHLYTDSLKLSSLYFADDMVILFSLNLEKIVI